MNKPSNTILIVQFAIAVMFFIFAMIHWWAGEYSHATLESLWFMFSLASFVRMVDGMDA